MPYFYSHVINLEVIIASLDSLNLEHKHKAHLSALVDTTIHNTILDLVLSKLSLEDREKFVKMVHTNPEDVNIMEFLDSKIEKVEDKIMVTVEELKRELHADISEAQNLKGGKSNV